MPAGEGTVGPRLRGLAGTRVRRLRDSGLPVLQCALAAGLAYLVARDVVGHPLPFFAPIACVLVLGVGVTNRLRRSVELAVGVSVGVAVGDLIVVLIGPGWWQISVVVGLALLAALLFDVGALLLNQAAVSAVLVATLQPPGTTAAFSRWIDTLIGAAIGLATAATLPSHPLTRARRGLSALLTELEAVLAGTADALDGVDLDAAAGVLERARATQGRVDALSDAVDAGFEITTIAPLRRRHRGELARLRTAVRPVDLALRNARVLARRAHAAIRDGERPDPDLVAVLRRLAVDTRTLRGELTRGEPTDGARDALLETVGTLPVRGGGYSADVVLAQIRSMLVDLLTAAGTDRDEAVAATTSTRLDRDDPEGS
ncbi:FUSC family protein [Actinomycetospora lemnae]|uniref:FUSC family protein n=1 Tax=Actinomycetospora lemnae TaxID=3019891 RepID=A0ABT5SS41_9PSEU|nr:FUSC family protein [Actinomycetospora sp. DW7H6]MDD7965667.1 FUSC family protein [Actinomycetospora sp. DW7H6]